MPLLIIQISKINTCCLCGQVCKLGLVPLCVHAMVGYDVRWWDVNFIDILRFRVVETRGLLNLWLENCMFNSYLNVIRIHCHFVLHINYTTIYYLVVCFSFSTLTSVQWFLSLHRNFVHQSLFFIGWLVFNHIQLNVHYHVLFIYYSTLKLDHYTIICFHYAHVPLCYVTCHQMI